MSKIDFLKSLLCLMQISLLLLKYKKRKYIPRKKYYFIEIKIKLMVLLHQSNNLNSK